jgi:hypothetical protein
MLKIYPSSDVQSICVILEKNQGEKQQMLTKKNLTS